MVSVAAVVAVVRGHNRQNALVVQLRPLEEVVVLMIMLRRK